MSYVPLKTKFENLVCRVSQKVFELEPSYLVYWLRLRRRLPDYFLRTFRKILTKILHFEMFTPFLTCLQKAYILFCFWVKVKTEATEKLLHSSNESYKLPVLGQAYSCRRSVLQTRISSFITFALLNNINTCHYVISRRARYSLPESHFINILVKIAKRR